MSHWRKSLRGGLPDGDSQTTGGGEYIPSPPGFSTSDEDMEFAAKVWSFAVLGIPPIGVILSLMLWGFLHWVGVLA